MKKNDLKDPEYLEAQIEQTKDSLIALCEQLITVDKELGLEMLYEARMSFDLLYKHNNI